MSKYNGWSNRETWLVNVWFELESKADVEEARRCVQEMYESLGTGLMADMVNIDAINWDELMDSVPDYDDEEE